MTVVETLPGQSDSADRIPLSFNQEFLCMFDRGDDEGPFGPTYNIVGGWRIKGTVRTDILQAALDDVVQRHETLRTSIIRGDDKYQRVLPAGPAKVSERDLSGVDPSQRGRRAEDLLIELEAGEYSIHDLPLVRAVLGRFDDEDSVLALIAHHSAVDEWSLQLLIRDLAARYAVRSGHEVDLPPVRQFREFAEWERQRAGSAAVHRAREYWRDKLRDAQIVPMKTDKPRSAGLPKSTSWYRFALPAELTTATLELAKSTRSSVFMVLLAVYKEFLRQTAGVSDITVPTFTAGRGQAKFQDTVGSFFNFVPLRTDLGGCETFRDVLDRTRATCIEAYSRDIAFPQILEVAPTLMGAAIADDQAICLFQVRQLPFDMDRRRVGDLEYSEIRKRVLSQSKGGDVPDGALFQLDIDPSGEMVGLVCFNTNLFDERTIEERVSNFHRVLRDAVTAPHAPLPTGGPR
ncbi:MAG TPA: condensation domain-containing protein [Actinophytocola sp.]|uniref:condensation domain-containing protein n=1 Tax=Actinophytocola sp. TaxID=1872138 RepID=UPI002DDD3E2B|nr:condensation domain-containing protein [Actinophytocola sp.]HEV2780623.1 condensation domain-containing protein [Actinophytocola sp.]